MENFPKGDSEIQQSDTGDSAAHPARSDYSLERIRARLSGGVQKKIVVTPVAQTQRALRNPRQECKHDADFEAENDIENYA
jgi:hypothetical protein